MQPTGRTCIRYSDDVGTIDPGKAQTFERIVAVMGKGGETSPERYKHCVRAVSREGA